jgi:IS1 family transposase
MILRWFEERRLWICIERETEQILAFYVGARERTGAKALEEKIHDTRKLVLQFYAKWQKYKKLFLVNQVRFH